MGWAMQQTELDYKTLMEDLKDEQDQTKRTKADCVMMCKALTDLKAQKEVLSVRKIFLSRKRNGSETVIKLRIKLGKRR